MALLTNPRISLAIILDTETGNFGLINSMVAAFSAMMQVFLEDLPHSSPNYSAQRVDRNCFVALQSLWQPMTRNVIPNRKASQSYRFSAKILYSKMNCFVGEFGEMIGDRKDK